MSNERNHALRLTLGAICLALCMVLPFVTGQIPQIGAMLCPMHIPVLLCGFICGPIYGAIVGAVAPLLRFALFGMPPIFPTGVSMAFELLTYGAVAGGMYGRLKKSRRSVYASLIAAMLMGRAVWGAVSWLILGTSGAGFTWTAFVAGALMNAVPGIALQLVLVPVIVMALGRALPWMKG